MADGDDVSYWIDLLKQGDAAAAQPLWERYFDRLVRFARAKLQGASLAARDEEDVALSAFQAFCTGAKAGRFPRLEDRDDLWRILAAVAGRKASNQHRDQRRQKRDASRILDEATLEGSGPGIGSLKGREPSPDLAAIVAEEFRRLLNALEDATLRAVAVAKMEGYANEEISQRLGMALRTVERKLGLIRKSWEALIPAPEN